jgi:hypothetical protein
VPKQQQLLHYEYSQPWKSTTYKKMNVLDIIYYSTIPSYLLLDAGLEALVVLTVQSSTYKGRRARTRRDETWGRK